MTVCRELSCDDVGFLRSVYHELLEGSLPADELDSEATFLADVASGAALGMALADPPDTPLSTIVGYPYGDRVLLIGYIATRRELRSRGLGAQILGRAADRWYRPDRFTLALAEVDDPRAHPGADAVRRLRFYRRHGAKLLARPYFQPRLGPGRPRAYGLLLITLWSAGAALRHGGLRPDLVVSFLRAYFAASEARAPDDVEFAALIAAYQATPAVPLVSLEAYPSVPLIAPGT